MWMRMMGAVCMRWSHSVVGVLVVLSATQAHASLSSRQAADVLSQQSKLGQVTQRDVAAYLSRKSAARDSAVQHVAITAHQGTTAEDPDAHNSGVVAATWDSLVNAVIGAKASDMSRRQLLRRGSSEDAQRKRKGGLSSDALSTVHHMVNGRAAAKNVAAIRQGGAPGESGGTGGAVDALVASIKSDADSGQLKMMRHLPSKHYFDDLPMTTTVVDDTGDLDSGDLNLAATHLSSKQHRSSGNKHSVSVLDTVMHSAGGKQRNTGSSGSSSAGHVLGRAGATTGRKSVKASGSSRLHGMARESQEGLSDDEVASSLNSAAVAAAFEDAVAGDVDSGSGTPAEAAVGLEDGELDSLSSDKGLLWSKEHWSNDDNAPSAPRQRHHDSAAGHRHHRGSNGGTRRRSAVAGATAGSDDVQHIGALSSRGLAGAKLSWLVAGVGSLLLICVLWLARKHPQIKRLHASLQRPVRRGSTAR